ncbi:MAG: bacterial Ig-like domain-containing protein [Bacilli bacterium]|nr:bacterial Ig-like domain-containing protein [Bacilli bacterium]
MNNKKKLALLSLVLAAGMVFGACTPKANPSSGSNSEPEASSITPSSEDSSAPSSQDSSANPSSSSVAPVVTLVSIKVTAPTKTAYTTADTALDLAGMVVTANYSDQTTQVITTGYTVSTVDFSSAGEKTVTVTYEGKTDTFKINVANQKFTVKFVVNGTEVQTSQVEKGQKASYTGETPTKDGDADAVKYRFTGWDKDLNQAITADTTFTAQFAAYAYQQSIDDFESYTSNGDLADAGWKALGYSNETKTWTEDTKAAVSLGSKSVEGKKALRFDAWENNVGYKFAKDIGSTELAKCANALKFRLQVPSINTVKVILVGSEIDIPVLGRKTPSFTYTFQPTTSEYAEYIIPIADPGWALWGEATKTIPVAAGMAGIHEDDFVPMLTRIEFYVQGDDGIGGQPYFAFLDSIRFVTLDNPANAQNESMGQYTKYTGLLNDGHTVKVELGANNTATATVIDMETPQQIPGNVAIDANKNMTFTSADNGATLVYKAALKNGGQSMKFVEAGGALASAVTGVNLNAVQVVDNYEQYAESGKMYYQSNMDMNARSGARGAYYGEFYSGGSHEYETFGGNGWVLMAGNGDQVSLMKDGGHSGSNYLSLKNSNGNAMRYMQFGLFDGTSEQNNFRGSKLSFWAKTNGKVPAFKVAMYSQTKPRNATKDNYVKQETFTQTAAIGQWTHFEIDLNPALTYYGFLVFMEKNGASSASYLFIDDVEVYTANPYATYVPPVPPVEDKALIPGNAYLGKIGGLINATLRIKSDTEVSLAAPGMTMKLDGTYTIAEDELTMVVGGATYKATISEDLDKLSFVSVTGEGQVAGALNNLSFDIVRGENVESYTETGRTIKNGDEDETKNSGSSGAFYIDMYKGGTSTSSPVGGSGWALTGSGAGAALNKEDAAEGSQSLKLLNSQWGNMRYIQWDLYKGTAKPMTGMTSFSLYLKNYSADVTQKVKIMAYKVQKVESSTQGASYRSELEVTLEAGQDWTKYTVALDATKTYYGFAILNNTKGSSSGKDYYVGADGMCFSNVDNDPSLNYYAKKDLTLNGTIALGAASVKFDEGGKAYFTCAGAELDNVQCSYTTAMNGANQEMTITVGGNVIKGVYAVAPNGKATFTVSEVTGDYAAAIPVDTVFSNQ